VVSLLLTPFLLNSRLQHVTLCSVKRSLLLPFRMGLSALVFLVVLAALFFLYEALSFVSVGETIPIPYVLYTLVSNLDVLFISALAFSAVAELFGLLKNPGIKILSFVLLFLTTGAGLYFGLFGVSVLRHSSSLVQVREIAPFVPGFVYRLDRGSFWAGERSGLMMKNLVVQEPDTQPFLRRYPEALYDSKTGSLRFPQDGRSLALAGGPGEMSTGVNPLRVPVFLDSLYRDLDSFVPGLTPRATLDIPALIFCASFAFFLFSLYAAVRISRWPLFNFFIALFLLRFSWQLPAFLGAGLVRDILKTVGFPATMLPYLIPGAFTLIALAFFGIILLRKPLAEWRQEMGYD
jgi:hypothetical protein